MGLTAKLTGSYRKNGKRMFTYVVNGTTNEKEAFIAAKKLNYAASDHVFTDGPNVGKPMHIISEFINGQKQIIRQQYNLTITPNNKIVIDDTTDLVARDARIEGIMELEAGKLMALQMFGVQQPTAATVQQPAVRKLADPAELEIENTTEGGTEDVPSLDNAAVGAGTDNIGD